MSESELTGCLLVAHDFPPLGGVGVHRAAKFARYLPEFGYRPLVFTARQTHPQLLDPSLEADLPDTVRIIRTPACSPTGPYQALRELVDGVRPQSGSQPGPAHLPARRRTRALSLANRIVFPDLMIGWRAVVPFFVPEVLTAGFPRIIWATSPPFSSLLVGRYLARRLRLPLVVDIRDMFCDNPHNPPSPWFAKRARRLEGTVLGDAAAVVAVTEGIAETLDKRYALGDKLSVIYNGFDFEPRVTPVPPCPPLRIGHVGSAVRSSGRDFDSLFEAWKLLQSREPDTARHLHFTQIGVMDRANHQAWDYYVRELGIESQVKLVPPVSQKEASAYLSQFNLLLLHNSAAIANGGFDRTALSTKVFEYLATNRKILALGGEGEAEHLIRKHQSGRIVPYDQPEHIAEALHDFYTDCKAGDCERAIGADIMAYHRRSATQQLANLFSQFL